MHPQAPSSTARDDADESSKHGAIGHLSVEEELQQTVCEALIEDVGLDSSDIRVRVAKDTVVLSGSVQTPDALQRALRVARAQRGVQHVDVDDLSVRKA
jgi:osmotically-inducible protein OsmY